MTARLHHFRISHFNEKVRWALDFKRWPHERVAIVPGFHLRRVKKLTGQTQLPVLELDGEVLAGSSHIIAELEERRPDPPLYPTSEADRERARAIEAYFDTEVAPAVRRLFWWSYVQHPSMAARMATAGASTTARVVWRTVFPILRGAFSKKLGLDAAQVATARERLDEFVTRIESEIQPSGYLVGDRFGVADLAVAAIMSAVIRPPEFPYALPEPLPAELVELQAGITARRGYAWVRDIYARHRGSSSEVSSAA